MPLADLIEEYGARLALLSKRERKVLELAVQGFTDFQIARTLNLTISTVNSYWVRIRGKLGPFNRTEIAAEFFQHQARQEHASLREENRLLREEIRKATEVFHESHTVHVALRADAWHPTALLHLPEAILVTEPPATVVFANRRAWNLYRACPGELEGLPMGKLTAAATPERVREPCRELFEAHGPERETVGVDEPYYARRRDDSNFRAVLQAERFDAPQGSLAIVVVREYLSDLDTIVHALRRPLDVG